MPRGNNIWKKLSLDESPRLTTQLHPVSRIDTRHSFVSGFACLLNVNSRPVEETSLRALAQSLRYRGPDRQELWLGGNVGLCHTLLTSIDDSDIGRQPASLDGNLWISGCIRIDGREELLAKLDPGNTSALANTPDHKLVLLAYRKWGKDCLNRLLGDFAFALWDIDQQTLLCARDRFGMRQLCYAQAGNTFIISNSIDTIRQHPGISSRLDDKAIADFLLWGDHLQADNSRTTFADIHTLRPGHYLEIKQGVCNSAPYWQFPEYAPSLNYKNPADYVEHFLEIFQAAVKDRIRHKSVVVSISGGMDSSSIAATIRELQAAGNVCTELAASTVLYDSICASDERFFASLVAEKLGLSPQIIDGGLYPLLEPYKQTTRPMHLYQPQLWLEYQSRAAGVSSVMLTGDAGDNLMVGCGTVLNAMKRENPFRVLAEVARLRARYGASPPWGTGLGKLKRRLLAKSHPEDLYFIYPNWLNPDLEHQLKLKEYWQECCNSFANIKANPQLEFRDSLLGIDWNTDDYYMNPGCTLPEIRDPFLDTRLLEFFSRLPQLPWTFRKHILRESMRGKLPAAVISRPKTALGNIHHPLLQRSNRAEVYRWKSGNLLDNYIDKEKVCSIVKGVDSGENLYQNLTPVILDRWLASL